MKGGKFYSLRVTDDIMASQPKSYLFFKKAHKLFNELKDNGSLMISD